MFHVKHFLCDRVFGVSRETFLAAIHTRAKTARRVAARSKSGSYNVCAEQMLAYLWSVTCISIASSCSVISQRALCPC